jgi:tRNA pseudouridine55 synthase
MYDKARRGETVELSPRRISIYKFDIERSLEDRCSSFLPLPRTLNG